MTYEEFLEHIDQYVGHIVEFETKFKNTGKIYRMQRYVWDSKEFGPHPADALFDVLGVKDIGYKKTSSALGIKAV